MKFDGEVWRISRTVVSLPKEYWLGGIKNHITFGRKCTPNTKGAVQTEWHPKGDPDNKIYAKPIECDGHSLTNLMFGKDGHKYLMVDGRIYSRPFTRKKPDPSQEDVKKLADHLLKFGGNIFTVAERFGIDPKLGDRLFDLVKEQGVFKCELCDQWLHIDNRDKHMSGDICTECVDDMNGDEDEEPID